METEGFELEMDRVGDTQIISAKLTAEQDAGEIDAAVAGERPLQKLFSADQERLIAEFGPTDVGWEALTPMGPIAVQKWKIDAKKLGHEVVVERWKLPDKSDLVEGPSRSARRGDQAAKVRRLPGGRGPGGRRRPADQDTRRPDLFHHRAGLRRLNTQHRETGPIGLLDPGASARYHLSGAAALILHTGWQRSVRVPATWF